MMNRIVSMILLLCGISAYANAQSNLIKKGNNLYEKGNYKSAAEAYQQAIVKDPANIKGLFNLGNALYKQKQYDAARNALNATAKTVQDKNSKAAANYNVGNTYMHEQKWEDAIEAYKKALRNNPQDADAKYNLSYAQAMLKKQQGGGGGKNDKNDKNKDKNDKNKDQNGDNKDNNNKDQQDKNGDQNKDQQDKNKQDQDQNKQDQNKDQQDKDEQRRQPQPSKLSEQQAEQLLNALQQEEKKLQDKMQKGKGVPVKVDKDW